MKLTRNTLIILMTLLSLSGISQQKYPKTLINKKIPIEIMAVTVTPHVHISQDFYKAYDTFDEQDGALVQVILKNTGTNPLNMELLFNGTHPSDPKLIQSSGEPKYNNSSNIGNPSSIPEWTWCEMPGQKAYPGKSYILGAGKTDVFTYNSYRSKWGAGYSFMMNVSDIANHVEDSVLISCDLNSVSFESVSFLAQDTAIYPDSIVVHLKNNSDSDCKIESLKLYGPATDLKTDSTNGLLMLKQVADLNTFNEGGFLGSKDWSGFTALTGKLPLARGLVEVVLTIQGESSSIWAPVMLKRDYFDIGSGWLDAVPDNGMDFIKDVPLKCESFLKTLQRMHITAIHNNNVYNFIPGNVSTKYQFRHILNEFASIYNNPQIYNIDDYIRKTAHIACLGEPNWDKTGMESFNITRRYMLSNTFPKDEWHRPTGIDNSMPQRFRYYAGITDLPDFDNYRITAPSDDRWRSYSQRWGGVEIRWGAPLETIGDITRVLHAVSKPKPIAAWSQNVHYNWWGDFNSLRRPSPTPDEIYFQAYEALSNGVKSLYWYSLEASSILLFRDAINTTTKIGREIKLLEPLYLSGVPYYHERKNLEGNKFKPDADVNVIAAPESALIYILDLTYYPNTDKGINQFRFRGKKSVVNYRVPLPSYLKDVKVIKRIDAEGVYDVQWTKTDSGITILQDSIDKVGIYLATKNEKEISEILTRKESLKKYEENIGFNPGSSDTDFKILKSEMQTAPEITAKNEKSSGFELIWNKLKGATNYYLDISTDPDFKEFVPGFENRSLGNVALYLVEGLVQQTNYYCRLRAGNGKFVEAIPFTSADSKTVKVTTTTATANKDNVFINKLKVYPNPSKDYVLIQNAEGCKLKVYNIFGELVLVLEKLSLSDKINVQNFAAGVYILDFENNSEHQFIELIKQ